MTLSEIQDQINDFIVANGNNEITADVLRPILLGIVGQPNELIGDLATLTTDEQSSLVAAINEINASLANAGGITIHTGADTPLVTPPGSYTTGDFYLQEVASVAVSFWQFNGTIWVEIKNVIDDANTATSTTWSSEKIQQAINERDGFITLGAIAYTDNSATIPAGAEWRIAGVTYTNPAEVILSIDPATAGYYRTDIIVANTSNTFQIVEGTESTGTVAPAATPANTVKADEINIYGAAVVSTGPGGGFINVVGFFDYNDEATQTTPIAFSMGVPVKLTNDTLGPFTNLEEGPYGVTTIWDPINNRFNFSQLSVGDTLDLRIDLDVTTAGANQSVKVYLKMGVGGPSEYDLPIWDTTYKSAGEHKVGRYTGLYIGSEDIRDYPAELYLVSPDGSGTIKVNGWYPRIIRKGVNVYTLAVSDQDYVKKQFSGSYSYTVDGDNALIPLQPQGYSNLILTNAGLNSVDGFSLDLITGVPGAYVPYTGKILKIQNITGGDVVLTHDGAAEVPFFFRESADITIPDGEFIYLDYAIDGCTDGLRSWGGSGAVPSLQEVTDVGSTSTNSVQVAELATPAVKLLEGAFESVIKAEGITASRELFTPDANGTIATQEYVSNLLPAFDIIKDYPNQILISATGAGLTNIGTYAQTVTGTQTDILVGGGGVSYRKILSAATAGSNANFYDSGVYRVTGTKGFYYRARIKNDDPTNIPTARFSYGFSGTAIMGNINPSTYVQTLLSFGADNSDTNCQIIYKNSSGAATKIDLGATMPKSQTDDYVVEFWRIEGTTTINYRIKNLTTSAVVQGSFVFAFAGLALGCFRNNDIATTAVSFAVRRVELYIND